MDNGLEVVGNSAWVIIVRERASEGVRARARARESVSFSRRLGADFENLSVSEL